MRTLVPTAEQDNHNLAALYVIDSVARPKVDLQFNNARANAPRASWVSLLEPVDLGKNLGAPLPVSQIPQPCGEFFSAPDLQLARSLSIPINCNS